ncbi:hypothetical protein [Psychrobacillus sp. NPDC096623]|uniref:hypothetical protein n=1 Tax=Psychrobacillus sp. NPDC096623 TaxID=3364492 RepID=UPI0038120156
MYSLIEAQAMDYLLKRMQYNGLLQQITGNDSELKLVISLNNRYMSGDFFKYQQGNIEQYEITGPFGYEKLIYNNRSIEPFTELWSSFCDNYLPRNHTSIIKGIMDLTVLLQLLIDHVKIAEFPDVAIPLRPVFLNIGYFNNEKGLDFLYLGNRTIEIVSIVKREFE